MFGSFWPYSVGPFELFFHVLLRVLKQNPSLLFFFALVGHFFCVGRPKTFL